MNVAETFYPSFLIWHSVFYYLGYFIFSSLHSAIQGVDSLGLFRYCTLYTSFL